MKLNDVLWPRVVKISSYEVLSNHFIFYVDFLGRSKNRVLEYWTLLIAKVKNFLETII